MSITLLTTWPNQKFHFFLKIEKRYYECNFRYPILFTKREKRQRMQFKIDDKHGPWTMLSSYRDSCILCTSFAQPYMYSYLPTSLRIRHYKLWHKLSHTETIFPLYNDDKYWRPNWNGYKKIMGDNEVSFEIKMSGQYFRLWWSIFVQTTMPT